METVADRYRRLARGFATTIEGVPADGWATATPCDGWDARELVRHVVDSQNLFFGLVGRPPAEAPAVDDDPLGAWLATSAAVQADLEDPATAAVEFDGFFGRTSFEDGVDRFLCLDLVVHRWDLAHAVGLDDTIPPDDLAMVEQGVARFGDALRSPGAFGPAVEPAQGAGDQERLLAFLGRTP